MTSHPIKTSSQRWTPVSRGLDAVGDPWTLAIALVLASGRIRLVELHGRLPGVSAGVLDRHIRRMEGLDLVSRSRFREVPPRVEVELTEPGRELVQVARELARWAMRHMWSDSEDSSPDVDELLRMLPVLIDDGVELADGIIEAVVEYPSGATTRHILCAESSRLKVFDQETSEHSASVRVSGTVDAWLAALGPKHDLSGLRMTGEQSRIMECIFAGIPHAR